MTAVQKRRIRLFHDIQTSPNGLEVPENRLLSDAFEDNSKFLYEWCRCFGIEFEYNQQPIPEFNSPRTIIFKPSQQDQSEVDNFEEDLEESELYECDDDDEY